VQLLIDQILSKTIPANTQAVYAIIGGPGTGYVISETIPGVNRSISNMPIAGSVDSPTCSRKMYAKFYEQANVKCSSSYTCALSNGGSGKCCNLSLARVQYPTAGTACGSLLLNPKSGITSTPNNNIPLDHAIAFLAHELSEMSVAPINGQAQMNLVDSCRYELVDKCMNVMIANQASNYVYNIQLNGYNYAIFPAWDQINKVCSIGGSSLLNGGQQMIKSQIRDNFCINAPSTANIGAMLQVWDCFGGDNQRWTYNSIDQTIRLKQNGKCIDVPNSNAVGGQRVQTWDCNGGNAQKWIYNSIDRTIRYAANTGLCLDVLWASYVNGAALQIQGCWGVNNPAQTFQFVS
jgi:hypothetical protein